MLLRNKKTGEILHIGNIIVENPKKIDCGELTKCSSLAELNDEWEDYNPKVFYYINENGGVLRYIPSDPEGEDETYIKYQKEIGNHFSSGEEAEKAVEKLKALKRLKDKGMTKYSFHKEKTGIDLDFYTLTILAPRDKDSLDLLFGDENE